MTPVYWSTNNRLHDPGVEVQGGVMVAAFDRLDRVEECAAALAKLPSVDLRSPTPSDRSVVDGIHSAGLVDLIEHAWDRYENQRVDGAPLLFADTFPAGPRQSEAPEGQIDQIGAAALGRRVFDTITGIGPTTWEAAWSSIDVAVAAADELVASGSDGPGLAMGLCRPPGHHAAASTFGGGCYLNNAAVAAKRLLQRGNDRVAILDIDFHHGNGTQELFEHRSDVLYVSLHGDPRRCYPYFSGHADERGVGDGEGFTLNLPFGPHIDGGDYLELLFTALERIDEFDADAVVVSLGTDTLDGDPSGDAALRPDDLARVGQRIASLGLPTVALLEGGYGANFAEGVQEWTDGFLSDACAS